MTLPARDHRIDALRKGTHSAEDKCKALEREYPWIQNEMKDFGKKGSDYDWESNDPSEMFEEYEKARGTIDMLSKKVNKKVMQMFEKAEHEYTELKRKKDVVETDKSKLERSWTNLTRRNVKHWKLPGKKWMEILVQSFRPSCLGRPQSLNQLKEHHSWTVSRFT